MTYSWNVFAVSIIVPLFHVCQLCRYSSRAILIPFQAPSLKPCEREDRACFFDCLDTLSSTAGYVIAMGEKFLHEHDVVVHHFEAKIRDLYSGTPILQLAYYTSLHW